MIGKTGIMLILLALTGASLALGVAGSDSGTIPPGEAGAKAVLERSPRHHEWADIAFPGKGAKLSAFVAYPERSSRAPFVIVIHEIYGLTDWVRAVADRLAGDGFIAIAPDLLSGRGAGGGGTERFASRDDVVRAVRAVPASEVVTMLDAVSRYGRGLPAATGKFGVVGFCWGGAQGFHYATAQPDLGAAVVYYGTSPRSEALGMVRAPVLGLYGEDDARVNSTVEPAEKKMKELGKTFVTHTYRGAGHGFLRAQDGRDNANLEASEKVPGVRSGAAVPPWEARLRSIQGAMRWRTSRLNRLCAPDGCSSSCGEAAGVSARPVFRFGPAVALPHMVETPASNTAAGRRCSD